MVIDKNDYFEYLCTNTKALIKDSYINDLTIKYEEILKSNENKFEYRQGLLEQVNTNNTIDVRKISTGALDPVGYDYLVICTGA